MKRETILFKYEFLPNNQVFPVLVLMKLQLDGKFLPEFCQILMFRVFSGVQFVETV